MLTVYLPWVLFGVVSMLLCFSIYYNYKFARTIMRVEDAINLSLDELDDRYATISDILEMSSSFPKTVTLFLHQLGIIV